MLTSARRGYHPGVHVGSGGQMAVREGEEAGPIDPTRSRDELLLVISELEADRNRLVELERMAARVARAESLDDVCDAGLDTIQRALGVERSGILLLDDEGNLHLRAWRGLSERYRATIGGRPPLLMFGNDPTPIVVPDVLAEPILAPTHEALAAEGIRAMTVVPLVHAGNRLGALVYDGVLLEQELGFVQTVASHVAAMSERTRAENELRASRAELEVIFSGVGDGITAQNADGALVYANDAAARQLGFDTAAGLLAADVAAVVTEYEILDDYRRPLPFEELPGRVALRERRTVERTLCYRRRGASDEHWSIVRSTPVYGDDGEALLAINIFHDVTDRRESEERLRFLGEAGAVLSSTLDYELTLSELGRLVVPQFADYCLVDMLDDDGELIQVVHAHVDAGGDDVLAELRERYPVMANPGHPAKRVLDTGLSLLIEESTDAELRAASLDDDHFELYRRLDPTSYIVVPLRARGRTMGVISFGTGTSARRYDEDDLAFAEQLAARAAVAVDNARLFGELNAQRVELEQRARAAQALEFVGDGVALVDRDGAIALWNPAAARMTGLREAEVVGGPIEAALPGWRLVVDRIPVVQASDELAPRRAETVPLEIGGAERWLSVSGVAFPEGTVYAFRDLTDERAVERLKSDFVSTVSHELRTPLAAIYGAAVTLRRDDVTLTPEQQGGMLVVVAAESERLARIVNDILLASRLDSGLVEVTVGATDGAALAESVLESARTHVPAGIALDLTAPAGLPAVAADEDKVRQVLVNLVENAIKYSPDGGPVRVKVERAGARHVRFSVADEGLGIPPGEHGRIFEKFYRVDPNLTRGVGGTGLGLYICREIVRRMDGRLWVVSAPGRGSTFSFELPIAT